ncbi:hypothetical protein KY285_033542 [Solanum tuberosum]|nr:hypothetical protein KY285_033542 [Solanum tuberosum]
MTLLCELCRVVVTGKDDRCENPYIFQEYFDSTTFDLMIQYYGYDLLMSVIKYRHKTNSRDLKWWIDTKLIDIQAMRDLVEMIRSMKSENPNPDTNLSNLGSDSDSDQDPNLPPNDPVREAVDRASSPVRKTFVGEASVGKARVGKASVRKVSVDDHVLKAPSTVHVQASSSVRASSSPAPPAPASPDDPVRGASVRKTTVDDHDRGASVRKTIVDEPVKKTPSTVPIVRAFSPAPAPPASPDDHVRGASVRKTTVDDPVRGASVRKIVDDLVQKTLSTVLAVRASSPVLASPDDHVRGASVRKTTIDDLV